jgi:colanic acid/amylovoran biosynthesis glycosyltransferase
VKTLSLESERRADPGSVRPKLVIVATTFPGHPGDGTPEFVLTLAKSLADHEVTVVVPRMPGAPREETIEGVRVRRVAYFPSRWEGLASDAIMPTLRAQPWRAVEVPFLLGALFFGALKVVRHEHAEILNPHWILPAGAVAYLVGRVTRTPYVVTVLGADAYALKGRLARRLKRAILDGAAAVVPVSRDIARTLELKADTPVLRTTGVDTAAVRQEVGERRPERKVLLSIGRLADKKGFDVLLRAMAEVPDVRLELIGEGPERESLQALAHQLGITNRVRFAGRQPRDAVFSALARAEAVVIPSKVGAGGDSEGTPAVLCEAMAAGVPVVASALGGLAECIVDGETGVLVPPGDVGALIEALRRVADGAIDLETMGRAAAAEAERSLDINLIGRRYEEVLAAAVRRGP